MICPFSEFPGKSDRVPTNPRCASETPRTRSSETKKSHEILNNFERKFVIEDESYNYIRQVCEKHSYKYTPHGEWVLQIEHWTRYIPLRVI